MVDLIERVAEALARRDGCVEEFRDADDYRFSYMVEAKELVDQAGVAAEITELKTTIVAFLAPWAVQYAEQQGLPRMHLHPHHYDLLARCGARMVDFTRARE